MEWNPVVDKLILLMLANRTPPTCIQSNILAVADTILPGMNVVEELPCVKRIQDMWVVLKNSPRQPGCISKKCHHTVGTPGRKH